MARIGGSRRFLSELRRRRVWRVAAAYAVSAWVVVEVADTVFPRLFLPEWSVTAVIVAVVVGFPIALVLAWSFDIVPDASAGSAASRRRRWLRLGLAGCVLVAAVAAASVVWPRLVTPAAALDSIVVLPFENLSADPEQDFFVAGMYDALLGELGQVGALRVISRRSAMHYATSDNTIPEIARELNVDGVIEASIARTGESVRIRVQLIQALPDERPLWNETYVRDVRDVLVMHGDIARSIAQAIRIELTPEQARRLAAAPSVDPEIYEAYLLGMYHLNRSTPEGFETGLRYLHEAVQANPTDARAYAGLALGYATLGHGFEPSPDAWSRARAAALRAVALDPDLAEAHAALADVKYYYEWDWEGAERAFRRANELNPNLAMNHYHYAWFLAGFGRLEEAIAEHKRAQELDPLEPLHTAWLGALYTRDGRPDDGIREAQKAMDLRPNFPSGLFVLGDAYNAKGMHDSAIAAHERLVAETPVGRWVLARTYGLAGRTEDARRIAAELEAEPTSWNAFGLAAVYSVLGDKDRAFHWLDYEPRHAWFPAIRRTSLGWFSNLYDDPRYQDLIDQLELPPEQGEDVQEGEASLPDRSDSVRRSAASLAPEPTSA